MLVNMSTNREMYTDDLFVTWKDIDVGELERVDEKKLMYVLLLVWLRTWVITMYTRVDVRLP